ncbi:MAG TPA: nitronate monooxygenase, partial [Acetobacteraceae bacterium]|nr:nitronate monooxygenase [Acetobacteraceae bacterium]
MPITTRLTERLGVRHPVLLAPMDLVAGGRLAAAVSQAGGFGIIGGGYGDEAWLTREMDAAGDARVGVGFITWSMARQPRLLDLALERRPPAIMLSFGDIRPHAEKISRAGALLICQVQTLDQARDAAANGAD